MSSNQVGIGIIGVGYWGINYVRVFNDLPDSRVVMVCDKREERLREVKRRFPTMNVTEHVEDLLHAPEVDAVVICTEASNHYSVAKQAIEAKKHILVEKPMTVCTAHADEIIDLAGSANVKLMVGHIFLFNQGVRKVKTYLQTNQLGRIYYLYSRRTNLGPIRRDVNALWDLATHDLSIFNYLLDEVPEWVSAVGAKVLHNCCEDVGFVELGYPGEILGNIHASWVDPNKVREVVVVGSERRVVFNDLEIQEQVRIFEKGVSMEETLEPSGFGEYKLLMRDGDIISPRVEPGEPLRLQCAHFIDCILQNRTPLTDGQAGRAVVQVMEAIDRSLMQRGIPVEVNHKE